jgi:thiol:disulfide interchange protein/DsbC/DsbD-like thiol-disulfide interchange protein
MQKITMLLSVLAFVVFMPFAVKAEGSEKIVKDGVARYVSVNLYPEDSHITPGQRLRLVVEQNIADEWHTYWKNPGDSGEATRVKWTLPEGFEGGELQFTSPTRIPFGPLLNYGYSKQALFLTDITAPPIIKGDTVDVKARVEWLVCKDVCVPEMQEITLSLPVAREGQVVQGVTKRTTEIFAVTQSLLPKKVSWNGTLEEGDGTITLSFNGIKDVAANATSAEFFPYEWGIILYANAQEFTKTNDGFNLRMSRDTRALSEIKSLDGVLVLIDKYGVRTGYEISIPLPQNAVTPPVALFNEGGDKATDASPSSPKDMPTIWSALFFALLGGIILNLMPCVFPILSMKALSLIKLSDKEQSHAVSHGLLYTAGVLVSFLLIAGLLIGLQHAGAEIGWGFQLQNPAVVLVLSYLLLLIGLNLSGYFEITGRFTSAGQNLTNHHGASGSFFTGVLATLVATPCTAPFMGAALGFALVQPPLIAMAIFIALGFGLALPYLALCVFPPLRKLLPKPGHWMVTFKEFLAFPMFASAAWLLWVFAQQITSITHLFAGLIGAIGIVMAIWLWRQSGQTLWIKILSMLTAFLALAFAFTPLFSQHIVTKISSNNNVIDSSLLHGDSIPYTKQILDDALAGDNAVFINMTASWCITCKINEQVALVKPETMGLFKSKNVKYIVGDWTNQNPEITAYLASFGRNGVPLYVYYPPRDVITKERPAPKILPQLLSVGLIKDALESK